MDWLNRPQDWPSRILIDGPFIRFYDEANRLARIDEEFDPLLERLANESDDQWASRFDGVGEDDDDREHLAEQYAEEMAELEMFPSTICAALVVALVSSLESTLDELCQRFGKVGNLDLALRHLHGKGLERARTYLKRVVGVDFPEGRPWEEVCFLKKVRNKLIHVRGKVDPNDELEHAIEGRSGIELGQRPPSAGDLLLPRTIRIDRGFIGDYARWAVALCVDIREGAGLPADIHPPPDVDPEILKAAGKL